MSWFKIDHLSIFNQEMSRPTQVAGDFLFENQSLVDFQIGNEPPIAHGVHFLFENQPLVDFQIGKHETAQTQPSSGGGLHLC